MRLTRRWNLIKNRPLYLQRAFAVLRETEPETGQGKAARRERTIREDAWNDFRRGASERTGLRISGYRGSERDIYLDERRRIQGGPDGTTSSGQFAYER